MKLTELNLGQKVVVQIIWGENKIEFFSSVLGTSDKGVYVTPYIHKGSPLDLDIKNSNKLTSSIFANSPENNRRLSWRNIELSTEERNGEKVYHITTNGFNNMSKHDDRRKHDRFKIHRDGQIYDPETKKYTAVRVYDISDIGISFFTQPDFQPSANQLVLFFGDEVNGKHYDMRVDCVLVRSAKKNGMTFCGCRVIGENKDYLLYSFLRSLLNKNQGRDII